MKTIESILNSVPDRIYERGEDYYRFGNIIKISNNNGEYVADIEGSNGESYEVNLEINSNGSVKSFDCDCPYDYSPVCKHIVAVMLAIQNGEGKNNTLIDDRLNMLSKDELINILADWARDDYKIREKLNKKLNALLNKNYDVLSYIDSIIEEYSDDDGYVNYYSCYDMCMEIVDAIHDEYKYFERDNSLKHIQNFMCINRKLLELMECCDDSDGGLSTALSEVKEDLYKSCMTVYNSKNKKDCTDCLNLLCAESKNKCYDYWLDAKLELIHIAVLFSEYNSESVLKAIDSLIIQSQKDYKYCFEKAVLQKYEFLIQTENEKTADKFIFNYAELDAVCEYLIKQYIDEEKYEEAEKLCLGKLEKAGNKRVWNNMLSAIYEKSEQFDKLLNIELNDLLSGNSMKYDAVKKLMQKLGVWNKVYTDLIAKLSHKLPAHSYAEILKKEKEYEKLLDLVKRHRYLIEQCFKSLARYYPEEAYEMYCEYIIFTAKQTSARPQYQSLCEKISVLYNAGGKEKAKQLVIYLKNEYPRRPAFRDELERVAKKLK